VLVYGQLALCLPFVGLRLRLGHAAIVVISLLGSILVLALIGAVVPQGSTMDLTRGSLVAELDNLATPLAAILLVHIWLTIGANRRQLLHVVASVIVVGACVNAVIAFFATRVDLSPILSSFWEGSQRSLPNEFSLGSVAQNAAALGRQSGIYNQPAEAGLFYGLAFLGAVYIFSRRPGWLALACSCIVLGGVLSVSKVFLLVAFPIGAWQLLRVTKGRVKRILAVTFVGLGAAMAAQAGFLSDWAGATFLNRLLDPREGSVISLYTAGRFGSSGSVSAGFTDILHLSPWFGLGAGRVKLIYDSGWLEAMVVAGLGGVVLMASVFAVLARAWLAKRTSGPASRLGGALIVLALGAEFGIPAFTANRAGTLLWFLLSLTVLTDQFCSGSILPSGSEPRLGFANDFSGKMRSVAAWRVATNCIHQAEECGVHRG